MVRFDVQLVKVIVAGHFASYTMMAVRRVGVGEAVVVVERNVSDAIATKRNTTNERTSRRTHFFIWRLFLLVAVGFVFFLTVPLE